MTFEWIKIIASGLIGFSGSCIVQGLSAVLQERTQKRRLRRSLYRELAAIYIALRELLTHLNSISPIGREPNPANFPEFVKAACFDTAKSSPLFWRLDDAFGIVEAHRNFTFLALRNPEDMRSAGINVDLVLGNFRNMVRTTRLHRDVLLKAAEGELTEADLAGSPGK